MFCMEFEDIHRPFRRRNSLTLRQERILHALIVQQQLLSCLEVGLSNTVSTAIIAGALKDLGGGSLASLHLNNERPTKPDAEPNFSPIGASPLVTRHHGRQSVERFLRRNLSGEPHQKFDFCFLNCTGTPQELLLYIPILSELLKPESWIAIYEQQLPGRVVEHCGNMHLNAGSNNAVPVPDGVFKVLLEGNAPFCNFRRIERLYLAQKSPAPGSEYFGIMDVAVALAIERAYRDPDFRFALLVRPSVTLATLVGLNCTQFEGVSFRESASTRFRFDCTREAQSRVYHLEKPKWNTIKPEAYYLDLLAAGNSHASQS
jgi:predicted O-methyltransferase YrrM